MKAIILKEYGPPEVLQPGELPTPSPERGEVLIRVRATSVNPIDTKLRAGMPISPEPPAVLHGDVAGVVEAVGDGVHAFRPGDEVFGCAGGVRAGDRNINGALAEFMAADARLLARKPRSLSFEAAAALPLVSITAWEALYHRCALRERVRAARGPVGPSPAHAAPDQKAGESNVQILVHAGTGGVGHIAVQLARAAGAQVFTTISDETKAAAARSRGAHVTINYKELAVDDYVREHSCDGRGFDLVFDTVGGENLDRSFAAARPGGTVAAIAARSTHDLSPLHMKDLSLHVIFMLRPLLSGEGRDRHGNILREVAAMVYEDRLRPLVHERVFAFEEAAEAHRLLESGGATGKIVLRCDW